jgi:hypothetical protein
MTLRNFIDLGTKEISCLKHFVSSVLGVYLQQQFETVPQHILTGIVPGQYPAEISPDHPLPAKCQGNHRKLLHQQEQARTQVPWQMFYRFTTEPHRPAFQQRTAGAYGAE